MALVGNISGSGGISNTIGITGSLIIANPGLGAFPTFPGSDVALFVSGNIASKPATSPNLSVRGTTVFGGDVVISGTLFGGSPLHVGTFLSASQGAEIGGTVTFTSTTAPKFNNGLSGSLTKLPDGTSYLIAGTNITITTGSNGAVTIDSTGGSGGGFWFEGALNEIYSTGSVAIGTAQTADSQGTDVLFFVTGSNAGGAGTTALFSGPVVISGSSVSVKNTTGGNAVSLTNAGVVSGSGGFQVGGDITIAGNIDTDAAESKTLFASAGANSITIGGASSTVIAAGTLQVNGNISSDANEAKTIFNEVTSNTITIGAAGSTVAVDTLTVGGGFGSTGVTISSTGNISANGNLIVNGDLYISGTTTTIDSTVVEVQDPVIGLGFASGSVAILAGDRGFIGGIPGAGNNVAFVWSNSNSTFVATKTTSSPTGSVSTPVVLSNLQPIRASKFEVGGTGAFLTSSNGNALTASIASANPLNISFGGVPFGEIVESGADIKFGAVAGKNLVLSGGQITYVAGTNGFVFQRDGTVLGSVTGVASTSMTLAARAGATATSLVLSGSGLTLGANSTVVDFQFGTGAGSLRGLASNANGFTLGSQTGVNLNLSASNAFLMRHGTLGVDFQQHASSYLTVGSGSSTLSPNVSFITASVGKLMLVGGTSQAVVSGSEIFLDAGTTGISLRRDSNSFISFSSGSVNAVSIVTPSSTTANIFNTTVTTLNLGGAATAIEIGGPTGTTSINNSLTVDGNTTLGNLDTDKITFTAQAASSLVPDTNNAYDLGSPGLRWRNMYTGDLHLRNERGDWTIIEERDYLTITNNHSGKRYKFVLQEI